MKELIAEILGATIVATWKKISASANHKKKWCVAKFLKTG